LIKSPTLIPEYSYNCDEVGVEPNVTCNKVFCHNRNKMKYLYYQCMQQVTKFLPESDIDIDLHCKLEGVEVIVQS
jgi:hypothetical protein